MELAYAHHSKMSTRAWTTSNTFWFGTLSRRKSTLRIDRAIISWLKLAKGNASAYLIDVFDYPNKNLSPCRNISEEERPKKVNLVHLAAHIAKKHSWIHHRIMAEHVIYVYNRVKSVIELIALFNYNTNAVYCRKRLVAIGANGNIGDATDTVSILLEVTEIQTQLCFV